MHGLIAAAISLYGWHPIKINWKITREHEWYGIHCKRRLPSIESSKFAFHFDSNFKSVMRCMMRSCSICSDTRGRTFSPRICILNRLFQCIARLSFFVCVRYVCANFQVENWSTCHMAERQVLNKLRKKWRFANMCWVTTVYIRINWSILISHKKFFWFFFFNNEMKGNNTIKEHIRKHFKDLINYKTKVLENQNCCLLIPHTF